MPCGNKQCSEVGKCNFTVLDCPLYREQVDKGKVTKMLRRREEATAAQAGKTEDGEQEAIVSWCELNRIQVVHIPNEGKRSQAYGARMKRLGTQKGFPDMFFPYPVGNMHGLFIELKRDGKSRVSTEQREWLRRLNANGYLAMVCYGADEAIRTIKNYLTNNKKGATNAK